MVIAKCAEDKHICSWTLCRSICSFRQGQVLRSSVSVCHGKGVRVWERGLGLMGGRIVMVLFLILQNNLVDP